MGCNTEDILLYIEGELGPEEAARVRAHTAVCTSCRELLTTEQALASALGGLRDLEPPPDFASATVLRAQCDVSHALTSPREWQRAGAVTIGLTTLSLLLLWPTGFFGSVVEMFKPMRCLGRFAVGWVESSALSIFIICRTISRNLLAESALPVGAALAVLVLLLILLVWLIAGYRRFATEDERDHTP